MSTPLAPSLLRGGIVLADPVSGLPQRVIVLQYNPHEITRTLQTKSVGDSGDRSEALRLRGPAVETMRLEAELDATDQLEQPQAHPAVAEHGLGPAIAALESLVNPTSAQLRRVDRLASRGTLEIAPMEAPLAIFVWSPDRILPVRVTELSVTEEAFDTHLHPIRARATLALRVLSVDDLGFRHRGGAIFMATLQAREALAARATPGALDDLGLGRLP